MSSELRSELKRGNPIIAAWLTSASPLIAEAMASCGFNALIIDMEHGPIDEVSALTIFAAAERRGCPPLVRMPSADPYLARRLLDGGVQGLIIPCVENVAALDDFLRHCFYPPRGCRGTGLGRGNLWGDTFESHCTTFQPLIVPMIETCRGVAMAGAIAAHDAVDALFIGPYDLSADLGAPGDFSTEAYKNALNTTMDACRAAEKAPGIHQVAPVIDELRERLSEGYRFLAYGTDIIAMRRALSGLEGL